MKLTKSGRARLTKANLKAVGITKVVLTNYDTEGKGWDFYNEGNKLSSEELEIAFKKLKFKIKYGFLRALERARTKGVFREVGGVISAFV